MRLEDIPLVSGGGRLGHLDEFGRDRLGLFERFNRECGDVGRLGALAGSLVVANTPALVHEVLVEKARRFIKSPGLRGPLKPLAGQGLFTSEGELWRRQRLLMAPLFQHGQIARYAACMTECARAAVAGLEPGAEVDAARETTRIAMRIAGKALFDAETLDEADELGAALTDALHWANEQSSSPVLAMQAFLSSAVDEVAARLPEPLRRRGAALADAMIEPIRWPTASTRRLEAALAVIDRRVTRMIAERRAAGAGRSDLLSLLLEARDERGAPMSDRQIRDEIVTLFVAGHETTATALAWSLYLLARHPEAYRRVRAEVDALGGRPARFEDAPRLAYCLQVFKEAMRLYPPIYLFGRQSVEAVEVGGYALPRGTLVLICPYTLHRRPEIWPDPERFDPDRFTPAAEAARHRQAFLPFSSGPRICIGNHFALLEGPLVLATILQRVDLELLNPGPIAPDAFATLRPRGGVPMRVTAVHPVADA